MKSSEEIIQSAIKEKRRSLFEHEAKAILRSAGIIVPRSEIVEARDEKGLLAGGDKIGYPIAIKAESPAVLHKTEAGAILLDIRNRVELAAAVKQLAMNVAQRAPGAEIRHFLIEKMMPPGLELLVGGLRDEQFGPSIAFGLGGTWTEAIKDAAFGILPMNRDEMNRLIDRTRASHFLRGFRGAPPLDRDALLTLMAALSDLMTKHEQISEMELNPVRVYPRGAAALDARIILTDAL